MRIEIDKIKEQTPAKLSSLGVGSNFMYDDELWVLMSQPDERGYVHANNNSVGGVYVLWGQALVYPVCYEYVATAIRN